MRRTPCGAGGRDQNWRVSGGHLDHHKVGGGQSVSMESITFIASLGLTFLFFFLPYVQHKLGIKIISNNTILLLNMSRSPVCVFSATSSLSAWNADPELHTELTQSSFRRSRMWRMDYESLKYDPKYLDLLYFLVVIVVVIQSVPPNWIESNFSNQILIYWKSSPGFPCDDACTFIGWSNDCVQFLISIFFFLHNVPTSFKLGFICAWYYHKPTTNQSLTVILITFFFFLPLCWARLVPLRKSTKIGTGMWNLFFPPLVARGKNVSPEDLWKTVNLCATASMVKCYFLGPVSVMALWIRHYYPSLMSPLTVSHI